MNPLISIQALRAVAAWLVVFHHQYGLFHIQHFKYNPQLGYFGVDLFFVISGFIMFNSLAKRGCGAKEFFFKRLLRIVPAYWLFTLLMVLFSWLCIEEFAYTDWNSRTLIASLFFIITKNPSGKINYFPFLTVGWTLSFEMFFYACLSACILIFGKFRFWACAAILVTLPLIWENYQLYGLSTKLLYEFVFGILIGQGYLKLKDIKPSLLSALGVVLALLTVLCSQMDIQNALGGMLGLKRSLLACLLISAALCFESALSKIKHNAFRFLKYLGDISYSTYLVHPLVIGISLHYMGMQNSASGELLLLIVSSLAIVITSHLSYQHIETGFFVKMIKKKLNKLS